MILEAVREKYGVGAVGDGVVGGIGGGGKKSRVSGTGVGAERFRGTGKCPHGYMNWMVCGECNPVVEGVDSKKNAKVSGGVVAQDAVEGLVELGEIGGTPGLSRGGKAQSTLERMAEVFAGVEIKFGLRAQGHYETVERMRDEGKSWEDIGGKIGWAGSAVEEFFKIEVEKFPQWSEERMRRMAAEEDEALSACGGLLAISPELYAEMNRNKSIEVVNGEVSDVAGREDVGEGRRGGGRGGRAAEESSNVAETFAVGNRESVVKENEHGLGREEKGNRKARRSVGGHAGTGDPSGGQQARESVPDASGDTKPASRSENGPKRQQPSVNMDLLRDICAGKIPASQEEAEEIPEPHEVDLCGKNFFNDVDGENYICGKEKHGPKVKCGDWIKI